MLDMPESRKMTKHINGGQSNLHKWLASQKIGGAEELETFHMLQSQGRQTIDCLEERGIERDSMIFYERMRKGHHYSDQQQDEKGLSLVRPTWELCQRQCLA